MSEHLIITDDYQVFIKDYDQFTSSQVQQINRFNQLPRNERKVLLQK